jgi:thioredoxin 1
MASDKMLHLTDANFDSEVLKSNEPVLVDFWAAWCGPCRMLAPTMEELAGKFDGRAKVAKLNIDENPQTTQAYEVHSIPTVLLFHDGQVVESFVGVQPQSRYDHALAQRAA